MLFLTGAQPYEPVSGSGQGVQYVECCTIFRCHEVLHAPDETRIQGLQAFETARSDAASQRRAKLLHKTALVQKTQFLSYALFMPMVFHASRFLVFFDL